MERLKSQFQLQSYNLHYFYISSTVDNQPPTIQCPANIDRQLDCGQSSTSVTLSANGADNCGAVTIRYSSSGSSVFNAQAQNTATMNVGTSTVTATATDTRQLTVSCTFVVSVRAGKVMIPIHI